MDHTANQSRKSGSLLFMVVRKLIVGLGLLAFVGTCASLLGRFHWVLDVFSWFHLQYVVLLAFASGLLLLTRKRRALGVLCLIALGINLYLVAPFFVPAATPEPSADETLRVLTLNISTKTEGYPLVVEMLRERQPDIVFMSEVRADLVALLQAELGDLYPVQYAEPSRFTLGVAILARDADVVVQTVSADANMGRMPRRYLRADFEWGGRPITIAGIHPLPPMRGEWAVGRDRELGVMADLANSTDHPFMLVGDLNATPWSQAMRAMARDTTLRYASEGYGIRPTLLPGGNVVGPLVGAPLDHILVSTDWAVAAYTEAGDIGSDHRPVQVDVSLRGE